MSEVALEFDGVWKKFKKGEVFDSLRDLIPALAKSLFSRNNRGELQKREFWALQDVSFQVKRGEAFGIIGANGAGKSTILKLLSKILRPNRGRITTHGRLSALIEVGAGFHPDLTGRENVYLNGAILGMKRQEITQKFDEIVEFSGIGDFIDTPVKRYSSGMYARLGFAVAAHVDPDILLVDEVLAVGDAAFQKKCLGRMSEVSRGGRTVVFVSHNMGAVASLCTRALLLRQGQLAMDGTADAVIRQYLSSFMASAEHAFEHNPERSGNGWVRLTGARVLDDAGQPSTMLVAGRGATLEFLYENPRRVKQATVNITIYNHLGVGVTNLDMALTNSTAEELGICGKFACFIPNFPLPLGQYRVAVAVTANGQKTDHLPNALVFDVAASEFYSTGRTPGTQYAVCMVKHEWHHEATTPLASSPSFDARHVK